MELFERMVRSRPACLSPATCGSRPARRRPRARWDSASTTRLNGRPGGGIPFEALVEELERALILRASYATKWNQSRTADLLNLKRDKLRYRMKLYELAPEGKVYRDDDEENLSKAS